MSEYVRGICFSQAKVDGTFPSCTTRCPDGQKCTKQYEGKR
jgi:hypothetical protein